MSLKKLLILVAIGGVGYGYLSADKTPAPVYQEALLSPLGEQEPQEKRRHYRKKRLRQDFSRVLSERVRQRDERAVAGAEMPVDESAPDEVIDSYTYAQVSVSDFQNEFYQMKGADRVKAVQTLQFEVQSDQRLLEQMEMDQKSGLNITEADISAIRQRTENKRSKLNVFMSGMSAHEMEGRSNRGRAPATAPHSAPRRRTGEVTPGGALYETPEANNS